MIRTLAIYLAVTLLSVLAACAADDEPSQMKEDLESFRAYLKKEHTVKKWQVGPVRLDSPALRTAYGKQRIYFVYSSPPLPPGGARVSPAQEMYRRQVEDIRANFVSEAVRIDEKGQIVPLRTPKDYNGGLMKVASDEDARTAAAAILTIYRCDYVAPAVLDPKIVVVTKMDEGWSCKVIVNRLYRGEVIFDGNGQCTNVSKFYAGPLRP
jgi:hypothetical protein